MEIIRHVYLKSVINKIVVFDGTLYTVVPPNTAPPFTASPSIPPLIFKSQIRFLLVLHDSQYRRFRNTAGFSPVPRTAVLGGLTVVPRYCYQILSNLILKLVANWHLGDWRSQNSKGFNNSTWAGLRNKTSFYVKIQVHTLKNNYIWMFQYLQSIWIWNIKVFKK